VAQLTPSRQVNQLGGNLVTLGGAPSYAKNELLAVLAVSEKAMVIGRELLTASGD